MSQPDPFTEEFVKPIYMFNMSPGNDFPRIKNSVRAVEMLTNNHLITLPALTVNYRHLHYATGAVNLFSVSEKLYLPFIFLI